MESDIKQLRQMLDDFAATDDDLRRYELSWPPLPPGIYWRLRWMVGWTLRWLELTGLKKPDAWPVSLKHVADNRDVKPILIWAIGLDRETLRMACLEISEILVTLPGTAAVLVTDVVDFAFFSRLGWLVEYVPRLVGDGEAYDDRKIKFLARLYKDVQAFPLCAGREPHACASEFQRWLIPCK